MRPPCDGETWMADVDSANDPTNWRQPHPDYAAAQAICDRCPIATQIECLRYALKHDVAGFVAGTVAKQRNRLRRAVA